MVKILVGKKPLIFPNIRTSGSVYFTVRCSVKRRKQLATFYISYKVEDNEIVEALKPLLEEKGHTVRYDQELYIGSAWRDQLMAALIDSDGVVLIWSENTEKSQFVPAEAGAVRAMPRIGLFPVLVGDVSIPPFIQDVMVERLPNTEPEVLSNLADKLDESIKKHLEHVNRRQKDRPKLFISHRHKDENIARALVDCIKSYFRIDTQDIRCTSVRPYRLPVGENTAERLRDEIADAEVVLGILTPDTHESSYVLFELGSAWGQHVWTCPLLARGANQSHIPDPIRDLSPLSLQDAGECRQLLDDMAGFTSLERIDTEGGEIYDKIQALTTASVADTGSQS